MPWVSPANAATLLNVTERTIQRWASSGKLLCKTENTGRGRGGKSLFVFCDENIIDQTTTSNDMESTKAQYGQSKCGQPNDKGETTYVSCHKPNDNKLTISSVNDYVAQTTDQTSISNDTPQTTTSNDSQPYISLSIGQLAARLGVDQTKAYRLARGQKWTVEYRPLKKGGRVKIYHCPLSEVDRAKSAVTAPSMAVVAKTNALTVQDVPCLTTESSLPEKELQRAGLRAEFCQAAIAALADGHSWTDICASYNVGQWTELFSLEGKKSTRTLQGWVATYKNGTDATALARRYAGGRCQVTGPEQDFLLYYLLDGNRITPGAAVNMLKHAAGQGQIKSPSSARTLQRWVAVWAKEHALEWAKARMGDKYLKDNFMPSIMRDWSLLKVGDVACADGHDLAFDVKDPVTGKPCRP